MEWIRIRGARQHNLKNINLDIPRNRLVVLTGVSGSGKSSLAFDTLFAEGQRRYLEALSNRRRPYIQTLDKPEVDEILGISPAIAIEQRRVARNPRSTVGTLTEVHDYLRVLFARLGTPHCPGCGRAVLAHTVSEVLDETVRSWPQGSRLLVLAPVETVHEKKIGQLLRKLRKDGFARIWFDERIIELDPLPRLPRRPEYRFEVVVDRIVLDPSRQQRLREDVELAFKFGGGFMAIADMQGRARTFSDSLRCPSCKIDMPDVTPALFSFHHPQGMCPVCKGLGTSSAPTQKPVKGAAAGRAKSLPRTGGGKRLQTDGVDGREHESLSQPGEIHAGGEMTCTACGGSRLNAVSQSIRIEGLSIHQVSSMSVTELISWLKGLSFTPSREPIAGPLVAEILQRTTALAELGLGYLSLSRSTASLSGGEAQRVRLAQQIGARLTGIIYVLDEPSIGLHAHDHQRLMRIIRTLRDAGNSVIVVEHDRETILEADHVVDIGPGAGRLGGEVIFSGLPEQLLHCTSSLTGQYLSGAKSIDIPRRRVSRSNGRILITGASGHNLKDVDVEIPLGCVTCVTGVSGSGKSTLVLDTLYRLLAQRLYRATAAPAPYRDVQGVEAIRRVLLVDQSPVGKNPRSTPATYTGIFTPIRELFAKLPEARARGYSADRFSYNVRGGRCETCRGDGCIRVDLVFLPDVTFSCPACGGSRFSHETLQIRFKGHSIADVLSMSVNDALNLLENIPAVRNTLQVLQEVGLGYLILGQSALTLSGGESQLVKLAAELNLRSSEHTVFILDEPTTGLHFDDILKLVHILDRLARMGHTVILIEHHLDVIKCADYVIDLGPGGGRDGGNVVAVGSPGEIAAAEQSITGRYLRKLLC
jgi:excinuclease ABC subunit A